MKTLIAALALALPALAAAGTGVDTGDTALVLVSAGLVMLMTPGLAFFYGGLVRAKNVVQTMNLSIVCMGLVGVLWALVGYSIAFSPGGSSTWPSTCRSSRRAPLSPGSSPTSAARASSSGPSTSKRSAPRRRPPVLPTRPRRRTDRHGPAGKLGQPAPRD